MNKTYLVNEWEINNNIYGKTFLFEIFHKLIGYAFIVNAENDSDAISILLEWLDDNVNELELLDYDNNGYFPLFSFEHNIIIEVSAEKYQTLNHVEYKIPTHYLCLIFNGDESGLNEDDIQKWDNFVNREGLECGHWAMVDNDAEDYFSWSNDIDNLGNTVYDLIWVDMSGDESNDN